MQKYLAVGILTLLLAACAPVQQDMREGALNGDENAVGDRLNDSPRHQEWVQVQSGDRIVHAWIVYPERSEKAPVVVLIHENRGLNDWMRSFADRVAQEGYIAVAPDLLSGFSSSYGRTSDFPDEDAARDAISRLDSAQVQSDLEAVAAYAQTIPASNGSLVAAGFCWGGAQSFQFATESEAPDAVLVFYGTAPTQSGAYADISAPVYGFYAGNDERVNATIGTAEQLMEQEGKTFDYVMYDGAGHAFMRLGEDPASDPANKAARDAAWERMTEILSQFEE